MLEEDYIRQLAELPDVPTFAFFKLFEPDEEPMWACSPVMHEGAPLVLTPMQWVEVSWEHHRPSPIVCPKRNLQLNLAVCPNRLKEVWGIDLSEEGCFIIGSGLETEAELDAHQQAELDARQQAELDARQEAELEARQQAGEEQ